MISDLFTIHFYNLGGGEHAFDSAVVLSLFPHGSVAPLSLHENPCSDKGAPYNPQQVQGRIREILGKYSNGFWVSKLPQIYRELYKQELPTETIKDLETWTHICTVRTTSLRVSFHSCVAKYKPSCCVVHHHVTLLCPFYSFFIFSCSSSGIALNITHHLQKKRAYLNLSLFHTVS